MSTCTPQSRPDSVLYEAEEILIGELRRYTYPKILTASQPMRKLVRSKHDSKFECILSINVSFNAQVVESRQSNLRRDLRVLHVSATESYLGGVDG